MKIIKGDQVTILIGKDKGRSGEVIRSLPKKQQVVVKSLNLFKKHLKSQGNQKGGIIEKERPLDISKVILICPNCHKTTRVAYKIDKAGDKSRVCRRCHQIIAAKTK